MVGRLLLVGVGRIVRQLMGHSDFKTSEAYLSEFGSDVLDRADGRVF